MRPAGRPAHRAYGASSRRGLCSFPSSCLHPTPLWLPLSVPFGLDLCGALVSELGDGTFPFRQICISRFLFSLACLGLWAALPFLTPGIGLRRASNVHQFIFKHFEDALSAFSKRILARAPASPHSSARELRATGPCTLDRSWAFHRFILIAIVLLGGIHVAPLSSLLVLSFTQSLFSHYYLFIHFSAALVLSCSLGRKCSCIWQVLEVGFPGFSHFGKKKVRRSEYHEGIEKCRRC